MAKKLVYHWTAAVRIHHWVNLVALTLLVITGFYIHSPFMQGGGETMAWTRIVHLWMAYVLLFGLIARIYLMFNSRTGADWKELLPLPSNLKNIPDIALYYAFITNTHKHYSRYNPLQGLTYLFIGVMILFMAATGFALHTGWLHAQFNWVNTLVGGVMITRILHFFGMWILIIVSFMHVYFVLRQNALDHDRCFMSMFDGYCLKDESEAH
ncbi:MAG TPA: Ni/Fe-hydrogenase, b-type cytochrome subunit [Nitrospirota bacterium]|jgi:Ni/Fe-hydrogenase 1 B-type cytochrome subunit